MEIFISYTHADAEFAQKLSDDLRKEGLDVWRDQEQIRVGSNLVDSILSAIRSSTNYLALVSTNSSESPWVSSELATALAARETAPNRKIIPVVTEPNVELPPFLRQFKAVDLSSPDKYQHHLPELIAALKSEKLDGPSPTPQVLEQYEELMPGMAERMLVMAEKEQMYRWELEKSEHHGVAFSKSLIASLLGVVFFAALAVFGNDMMSSDIFKYLIGILVGALFPNIFTSLANKMVLRTKAGQGVKRD